MLGQLLTFFLPVTLLTITPGVDTVLIIRNSSRCGWRAGVVSSFGICCGLFVHALVSALGISLLLLQSALVFSLLKLAGAGYLVWLGLVSLNSAFGGRQVLPLPAARTTDLQLRCSFVEGLLSNVLNPKAIFFYMAFLPQFINPAGSVLGQSLLLAALHFVIAMLYQTLLAVLVERAGRWLNGSRVRRGQDIATGGVMVFFGLKLAFER
ncbi:LysE family translocator [Malonomonas rubra]|uniref:LysE family translocator n=1 Tax=Malonomonas rubra TaxID=57040 RepID=UPI0026F37645|nr:LysE family translocator [Malonomonas rubra]